MLIQKVAAVFFLTVGVSYLLNARLWAGYAKQLLAEPQRLLPILWVTLPIGLVIVFAHNVWSGWAIIITLVGWIITIKSAFYLLFPQVVKVFAGWSQKALRRYLIGGGAFMTMLGALLAYRYVI
jgi:hypothetical protein